MMLHPSLHTDAAVHRWRKRWNADACVRIEPLLRDDVASGLLAALREQAFTLMAAMSADLSFQYWVFNLRPDDCCEHPLCEFGRWLWTEGAMWLSRITGLELGPPDDRVVHSSLYTKGCYLDPHNDHDGARQVAFILGLTPEPVPEHAGGHLQFLRADGTHVRLVERRAPGWNTLDLFDVRAPTRPHRVPLVTRYVERRAISGWLYQRSA